MRLDVIIPSYNNQATIGRLLAALRHGLAPADRVVVVDDGSEDATPAIAERMVGELSGRLLLLRQAHRGPAAARNEGLRSATADVVLFLGADIIPTPVLLARHRAVHRAFPEESVGCVGLVTWDPSLPPTPLMVWLEHGGNQNAFGEIAGEEWVSPTAYCYGANLSLKRSLVESVGGFDAVHFPSYGWEDLDLGIRLARRGCRLKYEPAAKALHAHPQTLSSMVERQRLLGPGAVMLGRLHPDVLRPPAGGWENLRALLGRVCFPPPVEHALFWVAKRFGSRVMLPRVYQRLASFVFTKSVHAARSTPPSVERPPTVFPGIFDERP